MSDCSTNAFNTKSKWRTLDEGTARTRFRFANSEDAIEHICRECPIANLDFSEPDFCPIQAEYGFDGEHPKIQYDGCGHIRCLGFEEIRVAEQALYEKRMRGDWS